MLKGADTAVATIRRRVLFASAVVLWGLITHSTYAGTGDEPHYLAIAHSLAFDRDLEMSNNYVADESIVGGVAPGSHVLPGRDGKLRPLHDIGMPLLFVAYIALIHPLVQATVSSLPLAVLERFRLTPATIYRHLLSAGMIAVTLLLVHQLFAALIAVGISASLAGWTVLLVTLSPPLLIYSVLFFTEVVSALIGLVVFRAIMLDERGGNARLALAGILTGLLLLVHARNAGLVLALLVLAGYRWWQRGSSAYREWFSRAASLRGWRRGRR